MSQMVDRVAAAIHGVYGIMIPFAALDDNSELKKRLRSQAIAAIAAMYEPSEEMIDVGSSVDDAGGDFSVGRTAAEAAYKAMIGINFPLVGSNFPGTAKEVA